MLKALDPLSRYLMIGKLVAILGALALICYQGSQIHKWHTQADKISAAREADRIAYIAAQQQAQAKNKADIERTEQRQKEISDARVTDLNARLERITRELRDNPAAKGSAGRTDLPETGPTPCRAYDPAWLCLSPSDRLLAARNEERHDQLITWNKQQSGIDPNSR